jgi:hypothetical protein
MREVPVLCGFLAFPAVVDKALASVNGLRYFLSIINGSDWLAVSGRDKDATRVSAKGGSQIWLSEAKVLAVTAFGSEALAKKRLSGWLVNGKLPWDCLEWEGPDAEGRARLDLAELRREVREGRSTYPLAHWTDTVLKDVPEPPFHPGDPRFWAVAQSDWDNNEAHETVTGMRAQGVRLSRVHLLALLSESTDAEVSSDSARYAFAAARRLKAEGKIWFADGEWWAGEDWKKDAEGIWRIRVGKKKASKALVARLLEGEMEKAVESGEVRRSLRASYSEDHLVEWGIWPLNSFK